MLLGRPLVVIVFCMTSSMISKGVLPTLSLDFLFDPLSIDLARLLTPLVPGCSRFFFSRSVPQCLRDPGLVLLRVCLPRLKWSCLDGQNDGVVLWVYFLPSILRLGLFIRLRR